MRNLKISLCHYATTVVFVDDNQDYLTHLQGRFNELLPSVFFASPAQALNYLNETYQDEPFIKRCIAIPQDETSNHFESSVNIEAIQNELYRTQRFSEIAVVVVDYAMPAMNGIEFCKQIKSPNILVILLTGEADVNIAIKAFNEGIIDKFIEKKPNIKEELYEEIQKLERHYFISLSNIIMHQAHPENLTSLEDDDVAKKFYQFCQTHNIVEHYIISENGDFLLIDKSGKPFWLVIKSDSEIQRLYDYADLMQAPDAVLKALQNREKLPLFYSASDSQPSTDDWENYLSPAYPISNAKHYYYAYKTTDNSHRVGDLLSYQAYLANA